MSTITASQLFKAPALVQGLFIWFVAFATPSLGNAQAIFNNRALVHPVFAANAMVATQEALATRVGVEILENGGNAVDAAVAVGFALAVTLPRAGNLGGGGFMLIHAQAQDKTIALDFREMAPAKATRDMYLDEAGNPVPERSRFSHLAVGVPGTVAGLIHALENYGTLPLEEVVAPAMDLAVNGIAVTPDLANSLAGLAERLKRWPATAAIFFKEDGSPFGVGETLVQADLAQTLSLIAQRGREGFYQGSVAEAIAADMAANDGLITLEDLANYTVVERAPVTGQYRGFEIRSMPPPSSGGVHLIQILNILEGYPMGALGHNGASSIHRMVEAMKLAYADRSEYLGDPDFVDIPVAGLIHKDYAAELRRGIDLARATPASQIEPGNPLPFESNETTHYSVMDGAGNAVAVTYTLNFSYGTGITAPGTGVLLNNEMDDFAAKPGVPNAYGLIGGDANAVAPQKRPLSSMTPTLVFRDGQPFIATGSPGGSRIITTTLQIILNVIDHGMNIAEATVMPRIHHQWLPDELRMERNGLSPDTVALLQAMGHTPVVKNAMGSTQSIVRRENGLYGYSDPRRAGALTAGY
ncbi:MAG: gamma-glutamyltransferase [Candidatus Competibacterales bacterium]